MAPTEGESARRWLPANIRRHRERAGLSQARLATAMSERGHKWHPATVQRIEGGTQPPSVYELADLASVFRTTMDRLLWAQGDDAAQMLAEQSMGQVRQAYNDIANGVAALRAAQAGAASTLRSLRHGKPSERASRAAAGLADVLDESTLEEALAEGEERWQRLRDGA